jgi:AcrR family transcriptional regulator
MVCSVPATVTERIIPIKLFEENSMPTGDDSAERPLSGRRAQAARNDPVILEAARTVFIDDPTAPVSAVAKQAGVGISALYRRFASKEEMFARLCHDGLAEYLRIANRALEADDPAEAFDQFLQGLVDADVHALTVKLAGRFTPPAELGPLVEEAGRLNRQLLKRAKDAGAIRAEIAENDLAMILEQLTAIRFGAAERTRALRRRYLAVQLDGLRPGSDRRLPGPAPKDEELAERWRTS